jgi:hypothetical protein
MKIFAKMIALEGHAPEGVKTLISFDQTPWLPYLFGDGEVPRSGIGGGDAGYAAQFPLKLCSKLKTDGPATFRSRGFEIRRHIFLQLGQFEKNAHEYPQKHIANKILIR